MRHGSPLLTSRISAWWMWPQMTPSSPCRRASPRSAVSYLARKETAFLTLCLRYPASDQYGNPNFRRIWLNPLLRIEVPS
jgi:hypothetical protein